MRPSMSRTRQTELQLRDEFEHKATLAGWAIVETEHAVRGISGDVIGQVDYLLRHEETGRVILVELKGGDAGCEQDRTLLSAVALGVFAAEDGLPYYVVTSALPRPGTTGGARVKHTVAAGIVAEWVTIHGKSGVAQLRRLKAVSP